MRLITLRHGQSGYNLRGLCNDDPAGNVDLTDVGIAQARQAADALTGEPIERIFCSPLLRARRTADIVGERVGQLPVTDERLADIRSGFDGRPVDEYFAAIAADPVNTRPQGGESLRDYFHRVDGFLDWLAGQPWQCVLLVAHEETLRMCRAHCEGLPLEAVVGRHFDNGVPYAWSLDAKA